MSLRRAETRHCEPKAKQSIRRRKMMKSYVYILFNKKNGTLYTGVTSNLKKRMYEHISKWSFIIAHINIISIMK